MRISNRIAGRNIVVGCIRRQWRHYQEFASDRPSRPLFQWDRRSRSFGLLAGVFADLGITGTAATGRAITQIPLGPGGTIDFTDVKIALGIGSDHVRPVEHTGFTASAAYPI